MLATYPTVVMLTKLHQKPSNSPDRKGRRNSSSLFQVSLTWI